MRVFLLALLTCPLLAQAQSLQDLMRKAGVGSSTAVSDATGGNYYPPFPEPPLHFPAPDLERKREPQPAAAPEANGLPANCTMSLEQWRGYCQSVPEMIGVSNNGVPMGRLPGNAGGGASFPINDVMDTPAFQLCRQMRGSFLQSGQPIGVMPGISPSAAAQHHIGVLAQTCESYKSQLKGNRKGALPW